MAIHISRVAAVAGFSLLLVTRVAHSEQNLHQAGELLWRGDGVSVHDNLVLSEETSPLGELCDAFNREHSAKYTSHTLSVVFAGDASTAIDYGDSYLDLVTSKVIPALEARCEWVNPLIRLYNFVSEVTIGGKFGNKGRRIYRSVDRWRKIQAIPWKERHAQGLDLKDDPLSECWARRSQRVWSLECSREYGMSPLPLEAYSSIAGLIAWELGVTGLSAGERRQLAVYEVKHSEEQALLKRREFQAQEHERQTARDREWSRSPCAEQSTISSNDGPSALDVCTTVASQLSKESVITTLASAIWAAFSENNERRPNAEFRLGAFDLQSCTPHPESSLRFECTYSFDLKRRGKPDPFSELLQGVIVGAGTGQLDFEKKHEQWRYLPPPPTPLNELPCCWRGDVRVQWGDCRNACSG